MDEHLLRYYQNELGYLHEEGVAFLDRHRNAGNELGILPGLGRSEDPHVERLLEGFSFLTARIRAKLDDEFPEITDALLGMLYPHVQRPVPSASVARFLLPAVPGGPPPPGGNQIEAGLQLRALHSSWRDCRFRTVYPVNLWPIDVQDARLVTDRERFPVGEKRPGDRGLIRLTLKCATQGGFGALGLDSLRFYLGGGTEERVGFALHELLGTAVSRVEVRARPDVDPAARVLLDPSHVKLVGFGRDEGLIPYPRRSPRAYRLIQEYLAFPKKFLFVDLTGLERITVLKDVAEVDVLFVLDRPAREQFAVGPEHFVLGCTPIVNLFKKAGKPFQITRTRTEYPVVPEMPDQDHVEVYSIEKVVGSGSMFGPTVTYEPFYSLTHDRDAAKLSSWHARRRPSRRKLRNGNVDPGTEIDLSFVNARFDPETPSREYVMVSLTCTNRDHAFGMPIGREQGDLEPEDPASTGPICCVEPISRSIRPSLGREAQWRLISNLSLNYLSLVDLRPVAAEEERNAGPHEDESPPSGRDALVGLLKAYHFSNDPTIDEQIEGIHSVESRRVTGFVPRSGPESAARRSPVGGVEITVTFDESKYANAGPFLLACVLETFFGLYVSINSFTRLIAKNRRGEVIKKWPPRIGEKTLL